MLANRRIGAFAISAIIVTLSLGASGCSTVAPPPEEEILTLEDAKFRTMALERDIAAFVPSRIQGVSRQNEYSTVIFPCLSGDDLSYWPGSMKIDLTDEFDSDAILTGMERKWSEKPGWTVERKLDHEEVPYLEMSTEDGYHFTVAFFGGPQFSINSFSACFTNDGLNDLEKF